jgi:hypothetical protein
MAVRRERLPGKYRINGSNCIVGGMLDGGRDADAVILAHAMELRKNRKGEDV